MGSGYVLVLAMLLLGGVIATLGDRIGMKVGKARLSLFNLRPRQTATVVSILTGGVISASTLAVLFGVSSQLRTGVFELGQIQTDLEESKEQLEATEAAKIAIEAELDEAAKRQDAAQAQLKRIDRSLKSALAQEKQTEAQLQQVRDRLLSVSSQASDLSREIQGLRQERQRLLSQQNKIQAQIAARDAEIQQRDVAIAQREARLIQLQEREALLAEQVSSLERQYEGLLRGNIALRRNQPLVISRPIRANSPGEATEIITDLLLEANQAALQQVIPGTEDSRPVINFTDRDIERLITRISDGQEYIVQILSAANYLTGDTCLSRGEQPCIQVLVTAVPNILIYDSGEQLAVTSLEGATLGNRQILEALDLLVASVQFRARQNGIVNDSIQVASNPGETLLDFIDAIRRYNRPLTLEASAVAPIYTTGPIRVELVAKAGEQILFGTAIPPAPDTEVNNGSTPPLEEASPP